LVCHPDKASNASGRKDLGQLRASEAGSGSEIAQRSKFVIQSAAKKPVDFFASPHEGRARRSSPSVGRGTKFSAIQNAPVGRAAVPAIAFHPFSVYAAAPLLPRGLSAALHRKSPRFFWVCSPPTQKDTFLNVAFPGAKFRVLLQKAMSDLLLELSSGAIFVAH